MSQTFVLSTIGAEDDAVCFTTDLPPTGRGGARRAARRQGARSVLRNSPRVRFLDSGTKGEAPQQPATEATAVNRGAQARLRDRRGRGARIGQKTGAPTPQRIYKHIRVTSRPWWPLAARRRLQTPRSGLAWMQTPGQPCMDAWPDQGMDQGMRLDSVRSL